MSEGGSYDAVVIGAGIGGLTAAAYLARAGHSVLLLEAQETAGGTCSALASLTGVRASLGAHTLHALDRRVVKDLGLVRRGLKFVSRDMPLIGLRPDGRHLVLGRDVHAASRAIAAYAPADAQAYRLYRKELFALARALRPWWWEAENAAPMPRRASHRRLLAQLGTTSAVAYLSGWFESEALKATLAFDAVSPFVPGSALTLVSRAAQEMCGLQGAVAVPQGGPAALAQMLIAAVREQGVEIRTASRVAKLILAGNAVAGVALESGDKIFAPMVLSDLSRRATLLDLAPTACIGLARTQALLRDAPQTGEAAMVFVLDAAPELGGLQATARFVIADRLEAYAGGRTRRLPDDLVLEAVIPTAAEPALAPSGQHVLSVRVHGLPLAVDGGWAAMAAPLAGRVVTLLERHMKHLRRHIVGVDIRLPNAMPVRDGNSFGGRLLAPFARRIATPIEGLLLCGGAAEPVDAVSGRAGRLAAAMAAVRLARERAR